MAGLTPQLSQNERNEWAERVLRENNHTDRERAIILGRNMSLSERGGILGSNQDLICAYLILSMNNVQNGQIVNPITGRLVAVGRSAHESLLNACNLRAARQRRGTTATPEQREAAQEIREVLGNLPTENVEDQRRAEAMRILGDTYNPIFALSNAENRSNLITLYENSLPPSELFRHVHQILHIQHLRRANLSPQQICAYFILSNYQINPVNGTDITNDPRERSRLLERCNLEQRREVAIPTQVTRIQQLNPTQSREELTQWARGIVGEVLIPGMIVENSEYRSQLTTRFAGNRSQIQQAMEELRAARGRLTPEEICAYLILSNYRINPTTGHRLQAGAATLNRLLSQCNLRQRINGVERTPVAEAVPRHIVREGPRSARPPTAQRRASTSREQTAENEQFNAESILNQCNNTFGHIANAEGNYFQELGKFMSKTCSKVLEPELSERDKPNAFVPRIQNVRARLVRTVGLRRDRYTIHNVDATNILPFIFNDWLIHQSDPNYFRSLFQSGGFYIVQNTFFGVGIDAGGVSKDTLNSLAQQIALFTSEGFPNAECGANAQKLFIETSEGSGRYTVNHKFRLTEFKMNIPDVTEREIRNIPELRTLQNGMGAPYREGYRHINERLNATYSTDIEKTNALCKFIGEYYVFCILNNIPIGINLSRTLLSFMYCSVVPYSARTTTFTNDYGKKISTYYLMDYSHSPGLARTIISRDGYMMMPDIYLTETGADASDVNIAGTFNGYHEQFYPDEPAFNLLENDVPVTKEELPNYIYRAAIADDLGITIPPRQKNEFIKNLINGITTLLSTHLYNAIRKKPLLTLDLLLSGYIMPTKPRENERLEPYPANHQFTEEDRESMKYLIYKKIQHNFVAAYTQQSTRIKNWFQEILFNYGSDYPTEDTPEEKEKLFIEFFKKLIKFWTGTSMVPVSAERNPIRINYIVVEGTRRRLPGSHTCFNTLDIPTNIESKEDLYNRLLIAVYQGNQGIALAGGGSRRKRQLSK